jgi:hypothetical protein
LGNVLKSRLSRYWPIAVIGTLFFLAIVGEVRSSRSQPPTRPSESFQQQQKTQNSLDNNSPIFVLKTVRWISKHHIAIEAFSAALLPFVTVILGWIAYRQFTTTHAQLRAYVMVDAAALKGLRPGEKPIARLSIKNSGQTPALNLTHWCMMGFDKYPISHPIDTGEEDSQMPRRPLAPHAVIHTTATTDRLMNEDTLRAMGRGEFAIYVVGQIRYTDAFGKHRETDFLLFAGGPIGITGEMASYTTGNRIT